MIDNMLFTPATWPPALLLAMRATHIPCQESGCWSIRRMDVDSQSASIYSVAHGRCIEPGLYTGLFRYTTATMHSYGECVMEDTPSELKKHLNFVLRAYGHVLVTGLGLGCVVRGLLMQPKVSTVTVIEKDPHVLKMVRPHLKHSDRLRIIEADALEWAADTEERFDFAWHDIWNDEDTSEELSITHLRLMQHLDSKVKYQGAWAMERWVGRFIPQWYENAPRDTPRAALAPQRHLVDNSAAC